MASQMSEAKYNSVQIKIENSGYGFKASGKTLLFAGFTAVYQEIKKEDDEDESSKLLPDLKEGEELDLIKLASEQKFTKPPLRYTDASLVKAMEDKGIGRPSTYASIISVLNKRKYVKKDGKYMVPTEVSYKITDMLMQYFTDIMDVSFTARMEDKLDDIEEGGVDWHKIISDFYPPFAEKLVFAANDGDEPTDILCEKCGHPMVRKAGRYGKFLACSNYPACSNIKSEGMEVSATKCPKCGANMVVKSGKYGKFLACPNYPECSTILPFESEVSTEKCPKCGEFMIYRVGKYGKYLSCAKCGTNKRMAELAGTCPVCGAPTQRMKSKAGKIYYSCSKYPECKFMSWDLPTGEKCPKCGKYLVKKGKNQIKCTGCDYTAQAEEEKKEDEYRARQNHRRGACGVRRGVLSRRARRQGRTLGTKARKAISRASLFGFLRTRVQQQFKERRRVRQRLRAVERRDAYARLARHRGGGQDQSPRGRRARRRQGSIFPYRHRNAQKTSQYRDRRKRGEGLSCNGIYDCRNRPAYER